MLAVMKNLIYVPWLVDIRTITSSHDCKNKNKRSENLLQQTSLLWARHRWSKLLHLRKRWMREEKACTPHSLWSPPFSITICYMKLDYMRIWSNIVCTKLPFFFHRSKIYSCITIAERGEAYAIILKITHNNPATSIRTSSCSKNCASKIAAAGKPTSKIATRMAVLVLIT